MPTPNSMRWPGLGLSAAVVAAGLTAAPAARAEVFFWDGDSQTRYEAVPGPAEHATFGRRAERPLTAMTPETSQQMAAVEQPKAEDDGLRSATEGTIYGDGHGNYVFVPRR